MQNNTKYSKLQVTSLIALRLLIGWHILYEGFAKLLNPQWKSAGFLNESQWILSEYADWATSNPSVLSAVDFLNTWVLIAIGLGLVLGLFARCASIAGAILIFIYYLNAPPIIGYEYILPPDTLHSVFEYPEQDMTLLYSGNLQSSRSQGRVFMGDDASMELGRNAVVTADRNSEKYAERIKSGFIDPGTLMISFNPEAGQIDAVTSASEKYYASPGLTTTTINGRRVDVTHLHLREWLNGVRNGGTPSVDIDMAFVEGITCLMAHKSYTEKRKVYWDENNQIIIEIKNKYNEI